eukprot:2580181-Lingulodinium_polyedra.AAC.1
MEWRTFKATFCQRFQDFLPHICMALGLSEPCAMADVDELYRNEILEDPSFKKQGRMCKLGA